jgi:hypothetical protein
MKSVRLIIESLQKIYRKNFTAYEINFWSFFFFSHFILQGYCWVLADNEDLTFPDVIDSRTFGPLPLNNILGRVMYAARSHVDHGPVENSIAGMESDAAVLEAELDLDTLVGESDEDSGRHREEKET